MRRNLFRAGCVSIQPKQSALSLATTRVVAARSSCVPAQCTKTFAARWDAAALLVKRGQRTNKQSKANRSFLKDRGAAAPRA